MNFLLLYFDFSYDFVKTWSASTSQHSQFSILRSKILDISKASINFLNMEDVKALLSCKQFAFIALSLILLNGKFNNLCFAWNLKWIKFSFEQIFCTWNHKSCFVSNNRYLYNKSKENWFPENIQSLKKRKAFVRFYVDEQWYESYKSITVYHKVLIMVYQFVLRLGKYSQKDNLKTVQVQSSKQSKQKLWWSLRGHSSQLSSLVRL